MKRNSILDNYEMYIWEKILGFFVRKCSEKFTENTRKTYEEFYKNIQKF